MTVAADRGSALTLARLVVSKIASPTSLNRLRRLAKNSYNIRLLLVRKYMLTTVCQYNVGGIRF
jgi:hypothetical protein